MKGFRFLILLLPVLFLGTGAALAQDEPNSWPHSTWKSKYYQKLEREYPVEKLARQFKGKELGRILEKSHGLHPELRIPVQHLLRFHAKYPDRYNTPMLGKGEQAHLYLTLLEVGEKFTAILPFMQAHNYRPDDLESLLPLRRKTPYQKRQTWKQRYFQQWPKGEKNFWANALEYLFEVGDFEKGGYNPHINFLGYTSLRNKTNLTADEHFIFLAQQGLCRFGTNSHPYWADYDDAAEPLALEYDLIYSIPQLKKLQVEFQEFPQIEAAITTNLRCARLVAKEFKASQEEALAHYCSLPDTHKVKHIELFMAVNALMLPDAQGKSQIHKALQLHIKEVAPKLIQTTLSNGDPYLWQAEIIGEGVKFESLPYLNMALFPNYLVFRGEFHAQSIFPPDSLRKLESYQLVFTANSCLYDKRSGKPRLEYPRNNYKILRQINRWKEIINNPQYKDYQKLAQNQISCYQKLLASAPNE